MVDFPTIFFLFGNFCCFVIKKFQKTFKEKYFREKKGKKLMRKSLEESFKRLKNGENFFCIQN